MATIGQAWADGAWDVSSWASGAWAGGSGGVEVAATLVTIELTTYAATVTVSGDVNVQAQRAQLRLQTHGASVSVGGAALQVGDVAIPLIQVGGASTRYIRMGTSRRMYDGNYRRSPRITYQVTQFETPPIPRATSALIRAELNASGPQNFAGVVFSQVAMVRNLQSAMADDVLEDDVLRFEVWEREP